MAESRKTRDRILIRDLRLRTIVGLNDWEREKRQEVVINITLHADLRPAGRSDQIGDSINYRSLTKAVIAHVEESSHYLVEAMAEKIAEIAIRDHGAPAAEVRVEKPGALRFADSVGVEIVRTREDFADSGSR
ncbi:MAG: dihydroneopterin aldolase [Thermoanaerobaculia bacterium]|nr:dihydroneopterin aldolase [Thermoanaerobaculia bacterium]